MFTKLKKSYFDINHGEFNVVINKFLIKKPKRYNILS